MNESAPTAPTANVTPPLLPLGLLLHAIGDETRWKILRALAAGEPLMVTEIAAAVGRSPDAAAKHLAVLRRAGITQIGRGRLQKLVPGFLVDPQNRVLDFGYLQLHLEVAEPA